MGPGHRARAPPLPLGTAPGGEPRAQHPRYTPECALFPSALKAIVPTVGRPLLLDSEMSDGAFSDTGSWRPTCGMSSPF